MKQKRLFPHSIENILGSKFADGSRDGKHYWLTPPEVYEKLDLEFNFDFDPCPHPLPEGFNGLDIEWGKSNYINPPFGSVLVNGKKTGPTAWAKKALLENSKGKTCLMIYPLPKWVLMLIEAGAEMRNLGDIKFLAIEDGSRGKGTGHHIACFILRGQNDHPTTNG